MARFVAKYVTLGSAHPNDFFVSYIMLWEQSVAKWIPKPGVTLIWNLKKHIESIHEDACYPCNKCEHT